jgi:tetratricopeptide (TPR) repeat protein
LSRRLSDRLRTATVFHALGEIYRKRGMLDRAREHMRQGLQLNETIGGRNRAISLIDLAYLEKLEGNLTRAIDIAREAHAISDQVKDRDICAMADNQLALYHLELGQLDEATSRALAALKVGLDDELSHHIPWAFELLAGVAGRKGDFERGARLIGYAEVAAAQSGRDELDAQDQKDLDWLTQPLRDHLSLEQFTGLKAEGAAWTVDQAVEETLKI